MPVTKHRLPQVRIQQPASATLGRKEVRTNPRSHCKKTSNGLKAERAVVLWTYKLTSVAPSVDRGLLTLLQLYCRLFNV